MKILWCITGAGHFLQECTDIMERSQDVTVAFSSAGEEVARMYGLFDRIKKISVETIIESEQGASFPMCGRMVKGEYDRLLVAPCTANTVAKAVNGIADSLVSNLIAQAQKSGIPAVILPTDSEGSQRTRIPVTIESDKCKNCEICPPMEDCPAVYLAERIRINLLKCNSCMNCISLCRYGAITFGEEIKVHPRKIDMENLEMLKRMKGIKVIRNPEEIKRGL